MKWAKGGEAEEEEEEEEEGKEEGEGGARGLLATLKIDIRGRLPNVVDWILTTLSLSLSLSLNDLEFLHPAAAENSTHSSAAYSIAEEAKTIFLSALTSLIHSAFAWVVSGNLLWDLTRCVASQDLRNLKRTSQSTIHNSKFN